MNNNFFNPWHHTPIGNDAPNIVTAIIEIPTATRAKYELNKETGRLRLDRVIFSSMYYPANYGFIPQTYCDDNDPLDILVLSQIEIRSLCEVNAKVIGVMRMIDQGEADDKIIAVAADDMSVSHINDITELPEHFLKEMRNFFEDYKKLENKTVVVEYFFKKETAIKIVLQSIEDYKKYMDKQVKY